MTPDPEPSAKEQEMPTPRTDAQSKVYRYRSLVSGLIYNHPEAAGDCEALVYVSESFARQLERDLSALRIAAESARVALDPFAVAANAYDPDEGDGALLAWLKEFTIQQLRDSRTALASLSVGVGKKNYPSNS